MKSLHPSLFNSLTRISKESQLIFRLDSFGSIGSMARRTAETVKKSTKAVGETPEKTTRVALKTKTYQAEKRWEKIKNKPGHSPGFKRKIEKLVAPLKAKWEQILKGGVTKSEVAAFKKIDAYLKAILIVLDESGQCFTDAGINLKNPKVAKEHQKWRAKLIKRLEGGKATPKQFIAETKKAQTHIIAAHILGTMSNDKKQTLIKELIKAKLVKLDTKEITVEMFVKILERINIGYKPLGSGDNKRIKALQAVVKIIQKLVRRTKGITITIEGGADSRSIIYGKRSLPRLRKLRALARKFANLPEKLRKKLEAKNQQLDFHDTGIMAIAFISDKAEKGKKSPFVKLLEETNADPNKRETLFGAGGLFNTLLALQRAENIAGDITDPKSLFYTTITIEVGADAQPIKYGKHSLPQLRKLRALARKFANLPEKLQKKLEAKSQQLDFHDTGIMAIAFISDKAKKGEKSPFVKLLEEADADPNKKKALFGASGLFNTLLALQKAENTGGDITSPNSLFYIDNCEVFVNAAKGKVDTKDRRSRIGLKLNIKISRKEKIKRA